MHEVLYLIVESHVPTDEDMVNIIDFLSLTHKPTKIQQQQKTQSASAGSSRNRKQPLSAQRSSPLPGTAQHMAEQQVNLANSIKHHSDWQLYTNAQV